MKCEYCFETKPDRCKLGTMAVSQERKGGMSDGNLERYLIRTARIDLCVRPTVRNRGIRKAARRRGIDSPV